MSKTILVYALAAWITMFDETYFINSNLARNRQHFHLWVHHSMKNVAVNNVAIPRYLFIRMCEIAFEHCPYPYGGTIHVKAEKMNGLSRIVIEDNGMTNGHFSRQEAHFRYGNRRYKMTMSTKPYAQVIIESGEQYEQAA